MKGLLDLFKQFTPDEHFDAIRIGEEAMRRRLRWDHPVHGPVWVCTLEDLVLAKLEWSDGTSELQLRDCRRLLALNRDCVDDPYLDRWASALGIADRLAGVRRAA